MVSSLNQERLTTFWDFTHDYKCGGIKGWEISSARRCSGGWKPAYVLSFLNGSAIQLLFAAFLSEKIQWKCVTSIKQRICPSQQVSGEKDSLLLPLFPRVGSVIIGCLVTFRLSWNGTPPPFHQALLYFYMANCTHGYFHAMTFLSRPLRS